MKKLIVLSVAAVFTMATQVVLAADPSASTGPKAQTTTSDLREFDKQIVKREVIVSHIESNYATEF